MMDFKEAEAFFRDQAFAFSQGQLRYLSFLFDVPTTYSMGTQSFPLVSTRAVEEHLQKLRGSLVRKGFHRSVSQLLHCNDTEQGGCRCLVTYRNLSREGDTVSIEHGSYFLRLALEGFWKISFVEFLDEPSADLAPELAIDRHGSFMS